MMPDKPHQHRQPWWREMSSVPDDDLVPGLPFHYHRPPKWIARCVVGLMLLGALNLAGLTMSLFYDVQQQQYVEGRGEYRDREAARAERESIERDRRSNCALLDVFPPSRLLDIAREEFGCGPGRPVEEFPPDVQQDLNGGVQPVRPSERPDD